MPDGTSKECEGSTSVSRKFDAEVRGDNWSAGRNHGAMRRVQIHDSKFVTLGNGNAENFGCWSWPDCRKGQQSSKQRDSRDGPKGGSSERVGIRNTPCSICKNLGSVDVCVFMGGARSGDLLGSKEEHARGGSYGCGPSVCPNGIERVAHDPTQQLELGPGYECFVRYNKCH
jgi:hypothetical protein